MTRRCRVGEKNNFSFACSRLSLRLSFRLPWSSCFLVAVGAFSCSSRSNFERTNERAEPSRIELTSGSGRTEGEVEGWQRRSCCGHCLCLCLCQLSAPTTNRRARASREQDKHTHFRSPIARYCFPASQRGALRWQASWQAS